MKSIIALMFLLIMMQACSSSEPTTSLHDQGKINLSVGKTSISSTIGFVRISLTSSQHASIEKEFDLAKVLNEDLTIPNLSVGTWTILVKLYSKSEDLIFTGQTDVEVTKNGITPVEIMDNPITGDIILSGTVISQLINSLVVIYPFSGNTNDYSGNNIDGISNGATLTGDRFGNENSAYFFDGINDFIHVERNKKLQIEGDLTISVWIKPESFKGDREGIICYQADNTDNPGTNALYNLDFSFNSNLLSYTHESGNGINNRHEFENFSFNKSEWYNIVIVRDTECKSVELFINGDKMDEFIYQDNPSNGYLSYLRIGEFQGTVKNERFFNGVIDDVIILNKSISAEEIKYFYALTN